MPQSSTVEQDPNVVRDIVLSRLRGRRARVYLYGSRARGEGTRTSDIDVGVVPAEPLTPSVLSDIREALEQSNVLWPVEIVDFSHVDAAFRKHALQDAIEWTD